jgi:Domain of unknown function (DUF4476)
MKKLFTLLLICVFATSANAFRGGTLKIRDADGRTIMVSINGKRFMQNSRVLTVRDVPCGNNRIKVYQYRQNNNGMAKANLIYSGMIQVDQNYIYRCTVEQGEDIMIRSYCCTTNDGFYNNQNNNNYQNNNQNNNQSYYDDYNDQDQDWNDNFWGNVNNGWHKHQEEFNNTNPIEPYYDNIDHKGNYNNYNNNDNGFNKKGMNPNTFAAFKQTVQNNSFDSGKQTLVKTQLNNTWITAAQLSELVALFNFESSKLEVAKYGATRVVDKQNLFIIYNNFEYESSKTDFAGFIGTLK